MRTRTLQKQSVSTPPHSVWDGTIKTIQNSTGEIHSIVPEFVSFKEAKAITGISDWTWREWADIGKCASVKMGHRVLIPVSEIQRLLTDGYRPVVRIYSEREEGER